LTTLYMVIPLASFALSLATAVMASYQLGVGDEELFTIISLGWSLHNAITYYFPLHYALFGYGRSLARVVVAGKLLLVLASSVAAAWTIKVTYYPGVRTNYLVAPIVVTCALVYAASYTLATTNTKPSKYCQYRQWRYDHPEGGTEATAAPLGTALTAVGTRVSQV
jgi:hypothetical protein